MKEPFNPDNRYGDDKVTEACGLFGVMDTTGGLLSGDYVIKGMTNMHVRSNGLGGGFAVYGLYPQHQDCYALHIMYMEHAAQHETEELLKLAFRIVYSEAIPIRETRGIVNPPAVWRYFVQPVPAKEGHHSDDDYTMAQVMRINLTIKDAFVFSSGKNMGAFKGVGYPEDIANYFRLDDYRGYLWTGHGRFPTNTPGWWGGAHPFSILDWTVVHNGELSSYGINRRHLEMYGYHCTMQTDTEVAAYAVDLLIRRHGLSIETTAKVLAPPLWEHIDRMPEAERDLHTTLRQVYGSLLLNGPFTIIIAHNGEMIGLTDRIRLRPLTAATKGTLLFLSSEESAIRLVCPDLDAAWIPMGGEPIIGSLHRPLPAPAREAQKLGVV